MNIKKRCARVWGCQGRMVDMVTEARLVKMVLQV
jgi:hypothetical protein